MNTDYLMHYGTPRHSGRYPWGSGEHPYQNEPWFTGWTELHKQGLSDREIAEQYKMSMSELRQRHSWGKDAEIAGKIAQARHFREDKQMSVKAIAERMGTSESNVRNWLDPMYQQRNEATKNVVETLEKQINQKGYIDIGKGVAESLGLTRTKMDAAVTVLKDEGYSYYTFSIEQATNPGKNTEFRVLAKPGTTYSEVYQNRDKILPPYDIHFVDNGMTAAHIYYPKSVDSKRIDFRLGDQVGEDGFKGSDRDGMIEVRRGAKDLNLGQAKYAQVRIAVDDQYYLKGVAVYSDNLPPGVDIRVHTHYNSKERALKPMEVDKSTGKIDADNPFGATIKAQNSYLDKDGKETLGCINIVNEEGEWGDWGSTKTLASQVLSKQSVDVAKRQLNLAYAQRYEEYQAIQKITNPTVKKKLLIDFAEECDKDAVNLKAAALPRQSAKLIISLPTLKEDEIYAPSYNDGEKVALIRYPHGGKFEIPILTVNNSNAEGKRVLTNEAKDAVGIHPRAAERLSGADFDGDTVLVIPNDKGLIQAAPALKELEGFDPKERYPYREGMRVMKASQKGNEMGNITNLITDMTLQDASSEELARAVKHSMVVIDAVKHKLDYKMSEEDNRIAELKEKYQGGKRAGASTLISKAKGQTSVLERDPNRPPIINPETGEKEYIYTNRAYGEVADPKTGKTYRKKLYPGQEGYDPKHMVTQKSTKMAEAKDAYKLSSGTKMESVYADYANSMKAMANEARKESLLQKSIEYNPNAAETYKDEVESLKKKIIGAKMDAPLERRAQVVANKIIETKRRANPDIYNKNTEDGKKNLKKLRNQTLAQQRAIVGKGQSRKFDISDREWEAIQSGAVRSSTLSDILNYANSDRVRELATPRESPLNSISPSRISLAKAMLNSGYTQSEVAEALDISVTSIRKYVL